MPCANQCGDSEIKYKGNGTQVLYTFPFEYLEQSDVGVDLYNETTRRWETTTNWSFENATTIRFTTAPPVPTLAETDFNIKIYRCTDIDTLIVQFNPGSAIRARDLNDNFEQLQLAIQEGRCQVPDWLFDYLDKYYWNKQEETTYSTDTWVDESDDDHVPTTGAVDAHVDEEILANWQNQRVVQSEQQTDGAAAKIDDEHVFTTAASKARHDMYHQDPKPAQPIYEQPGKEWFDTNELETYTWDANAEAWVDMGNAGPIGPQGDYGPPGKVVVSDIGPTNYPASGQNEARPLESGDLWYNSSIAALYVWYVDRTGGQWVSVTKTGPQGPEGPPGTGGSGGIPEAPIDNQIYGRQNAQWVTVANAGLTFTAPLVDTNGNVAIDLNSINPLP